MAVRSRARIVLVLLVVSLSPAAFAKGKSSSPHRTKSGSGLVSVRPYHKKTGTTVGPSVRTRPNHTQRDNLSTKGNTNPVTGKPGTKNPKY